MNRDGGWAHYVCAPTRQLYELHEDVPDAYAVVGASALPTAVHGCRRAGIGPGASVAVFGLGSVGLLCCQLARLFGATTVVGVNRSRQRLEAARSHLDVALPAAGDSQVLAGLVRSAGGQPAGVDVAIEATGNPGSAAAAIGSLKAGGVLLALGIPSAGNGFRLSAAEMIGRELTIRASNSHNRSDFRLGRDLLTHNRLDMSPIAGEEVALPDVPAAVGRMSADGQLNGLRRVVRVWP